MSVDWSVVDHLSTLVIAAATFVGYLTLRQSQQSLTHEDDRRRKISAIEQNAEFAREMIPSFMKLLESYFAEEKIHIEDGGANAPLEVSQQLAVAAKLHGNALESFALYVTYKLADEDLLFHTIGRAYCEQVSNLAKLCGFSDDVAVDSWRSVYDLHARWSARLAMAPVAFTAKDIDALPRP